MTAIARAFDVSGLPLVGIMLPVLDFILAHPFEKRPARPPVTTPSQDKLYTCPMVSNFESKRKDYSPHIVSQFATIAIFAPDCPVDNPDNATIRMVCAPKL